MVHYTIALAFILAATLFAIPLPLTPDPARANNIGDGQRGKFISGACVLAAAGTPGCCATLNNPGTCSGECAQSDAGKQGCGFGDSGDGTADAKSVSQTATAPAAVSAASAGGIDTGAPGSQKVGTGNGKQHITEPCGAEPKGRGSAVTVTNEHGKTGCGFTG